VPIWERTQAELGRLLAEGGADPEALYKGLRAMT
jgi:hypothetical protein